MAKRLRCRRSLPQCCYLRRHDLPPPFFFLWTSVLLNTTFYLSPRARLVLIEAPLSSFVLCLLYFVLFSFCLLRRLAFRLLHLDVLVVVNAVVAHTHTHTHTRTHTHTHSSLIRRHTRLLPRTSLLVSPPVSPPPLSPPATSRPSLYMKSRLAWRTYSTSGWACTRRT